MTIQQLEETFAVHLPDLERVRSSKCYWPDLHVVLTLPDICGALESSDGVATGARYRDWCARNLPKTLLTPADRYKIRCSVLHQGSSLPDTPSQYASVSFVDPDHAPGGAHGQLTTNPDGLNITLDVAMLADEMAAGLRHWFAWLQAVENGPVLANVVRNLPTLVRVQPKQIKILTASYMFNTTSST